MSPAPDLYGRYHKGLRLALGTLLARIGAADPADRQEWAAVVAEWQALDATLEAHSRHEDVYIHPLIREAAPAVAAALDAEHEHLETDLAKLRCGFAEVERASAPDERRRAAHVLYLDFSRFVADYFRHLLAEETAAMPELLRHFTAQKLLATLEAMLASIPPDRRMKDLALMAPALRPDELTALLAGIAAKAPPPAFQAARDVARAARGEAAFEAIDDALATTAVGQR
ncbi:MAG TPA: hemerythrin domain-containing protein [Bauldia sp.]|nr:hemerythrin domain-containing protein [Bauldia sp.]